MNMYIFLWFAVVFLGFGISSVTDGQGALLWTKKDLGCSLRDKTFVAVAAHFFDAANGFVVGETGEIESKASKLTIKKGIATCFSTYYSGSSSFNDIHFINNNRGWIVGSRLSTNKLVQPVLLESTDTGDTWVERNLSHLLLPKYQEAEFNTVYFNTKGTGFILGKVEDAEDRVRGIIVKSDSFTNVWDLTYVSEPDLALEDISFDLTGKYGWIITNMGVILKSEDGGMTWERLKTSFDYAFSKLAVVSSKEIWITSQSSTLLHTKDGGKTWHEVQIAVDPKISKTFAIWFSGIYFEDGVNGWIGGPNGLIMRTADAGKSWSMESFGEVGFIYSFSFIGKKGFAVANSGILETSSKQ